MLTFYADQPNKEQALKGIWAIYEVYTEFILNDNQKDKSIIGSKFLDFSNLYEDLKNYSKAFRFIIKFLLEDYNYGVITDWKCIKHPETGILAYSLDTIWKCTISVYLIP